ncbi:MAG TPA: bifunctional anthranilate synthase component I family protein/class IV aminotransferase, partial [Longimicrobiales bacterium]
VNLTTRLSASFEGDPVVLYESLRAAQGGGYHACIVTDAFAVVSASPELFFEKRGRRIRTRPMKGTRPRGRFSEEDASLAAELKASPKDRAENLMIVDLLRNDLGRIATVGTVEVTSLYDVESYRTVHQLTSTIEAELRDGVSLTDVFTALFPCGSVTGAPKISTMQVISELEDGARGLYCGALGVLAPGGDAVFNVAIRTVSIDRETRHAVYGTGAGITYDSDAAAEYAEIAAKTAVLLEAWPGFELLETMRVETTGIVRIERHIARLLESAGYFGFAVDEAVVRAALADIRVPAPARLRLLVNEHGSVRTDVLPLTAAVAPVVAWARAAVSSGDRFLFHKTTHRRAYDSRMIEGCWDVLLWNERGVVTEFTRGNVVAEIDGQLLTPLRSCGLLAGTFRAELLAAGVVRERVITRADIARASRVWLINSVREWVELSPRHLSNPPIPQ